MTFSKGATSPCYDALMSRAIAGLLIVVLSACGGRPRPPRVPVNAVGVAQPSGTGDVIGVVRGKPGLLLATCTAMICLQNRCLDTIEDGEGHFMFHDVPAGSHILTVFCGDRSVDAKIEVQPGTPTELSVTIDQTKPLPEEHILRARM
jgi:hypothetical protein